MLKQLEAELLTSAVTGKKIETMPDNSSVSSELLQPRPHFRTDLLLKPYKYPIGKNIRKFAEICWLIKLEKDGVLYFESVNAAYAELRDMKADEFIGRPAENFLSKEECSVLRENIYKAGRMGSHSYESTVKIDNDIRTLLTQIILLPSSNGSSHFSILTTDISALRLSAELYHNESVLLNTYIDMAGVMLVVLDKHGHVEMVNEKGAEILGFPKEKIIGKDWFRSFVPEKYSRRIRTKFNTLMTGKEPQRYFENPVKRQDGSERMIFWHSSLVKDGKGNVTGLVSSGEDITDHQKIRLELSQHSRDAEFMFRLSRTISDSTDIDDLMSRVSALIISYPNVLAGRICLSDIEGLEKCRDTGFGKHAHSLAMCFNEILNKFSSQSHTKHEILNIKTKFSYYGISRTANVTVIPMYTRNELQGILLVASEEADLSFTTFFEHIGVELGRGIKRKKVEIEHKIAEQLFSTVFHTNPDAMTLATAEGAIFMEVNEAFEEVTGFSRKEVIGRSAVEINSWGVPSDRKKLIALLKKEKKVSGFLTTLLKKDGTPFMGLFSASYINYRGKKCMLAVVKDVTDRINIEKEILNTKQLLERITSTTPSFICLHDVKADKILYRNKSVLESLGYKDEHLKKIAAYNLEQKNSMYHPEDLRKVNEFTERTYLLKSGELMKTEYRIKDVHGKWIWFQVTVAVFQEETETQPLLTINVFENITERKVTEESLARHTKEIELLFEASKYFSSTLDLNEIYDHMYKIISTIADCKELIVTTYEISKQMIHYTYLRSRTTDTRIDVSNIPPIPLAPPGFGIVSQVIRSGDSMILDEYSEQFRKVRTRHVINEFGQIVKDGTSTESPMSAMVIPIKLEYEILGVVQIYSNKKNAYTIDQLRLVESLIYQVALANKNATLYQKAQEEIHVRTLAEEQLKISESHLRQFAESVPDVIYRINYVTMNYEFLSPAIENMLGYSVKYAMSKPKEFIRKISYEADRNRVIEETRNYISKLQTEPPLQIECRLVKKNGDIIWVRDTIKFEYKNGRVAAAIGTMSDITKRVQEEEARRLRDERIIVYQSALLELSGLHNQDIESSFSSISEISAKAIGADKVSIWLLNHDDSVLECKESYISETGAHESGMTLSKVDYPGYFVLINSDGKITGSKTEEDGLSGFAEEILSPFGNKRTLISRIRLHGEFRGILCFEQKQSEIKEWRPEQYDFGVSVAGSVTLALESKEHSMAEEMIKKSLKDKELLLREIHHRVKNNLQVISSLLYLQSRKSNDPGVNEALLESQHRVKSMVLIHEKLYRSEDLASIDYAEYISALTNTLFRSYRLDSSRIKLDLNIGQIRLNTDAAVQCGLIINELVSNAIKHAFPQGKSGKIIIAFNCDSDGKYTLVVSDDGIGLSEDFEMDRRDTLGMQLVKTLVEQMDGSIEVSGTKGASFTIKFMLNK